jgi:hypothetical protein
MSTTERSGLQFAAGGVVAPRSRAAENAAEEVADGTCRGHRRFEEFQDSARFAVVAVILRVGGGLGRVQEFMFGGCTGGKRRLHSERSDGAEPFGRIIDCSTAFGDRERFVGAGCARPRTEGGDHR